MMIPGEILWGLEKAKEIDSSHVNEREGLCLGSSCFGGEVFFF